jgi:hypothetical protein
MKVQKDNETLNTIATLASKGSIGTADRTPGISKDQKEAGFMRAFNTTPPEQRRDLLVNNFNNHHAFVSSTVADTLQSAVRASVGGEYTDGFEAAYQQWLSLRGPNANSTPSAVSAYYGDLSPRMEQYHAIRSLDNQPGVALVAFKSAFGESAPHKRFTDKKEQAVAVKEVTDELSYYQPEMLGGQIDIRPETAEYLAGRLEPKAEAFRGVMGSTAKGAYKHAMAQAQAEGLEVTGGFAWENDKGQKPLSAYMQDTPTDRVGVIFRQAVESEVKRIGGSMDNVRIVRGADAGGEAQLFILSHGDDGSFKTSVLDTGKLYTYGKNMMVEKRHSRDLSFGPRITYNIDKDMPAPSASDAEWAAYRKAQASRKTSPQVIHDD